MSDAIHFDKLVSDLKIVVADTEELLRATAGAAGEKAGVLRERIQENLAKARANLAHAQASAVAHAKQAGRWTDDYVHNNPWRAVGIAAGAGLVIGLLIGRR